MTEFLQTIGLVALIGIVVIGYACCAINDDDD